VRIQFEVNGRPAEVDSPPMARLLDVLREDLHLTGSKEGCGEGECGACTVLIDGVATTSCLVPVVQVAGAKVCTVEGISDATLPSHVSKLSAVQRAFILHGAAQCGICTPGFIVMAHELLAREPHPSRQQVREELAGNLCRCTGYQKIIDAVVVALATNGDGEAVDDYSEMATIVPGLSGGGT
jgi:aerobic carbon-monoxide dehydrogenase small subunit